MNAARGCARQPPALAGGAVDGGAADADTAPASPREANGLSLARRRNAAAGYIFRLASLYIAAGALAVAAPKHIPAGAGAGDAGTSLAGNPEATLYERPRGDLKRTVDETFPGLVQDAAGYWNVSFQHLASFAIDLPAAPADASSAASPGVPAPSPVGSADVFKIRIPARVQALNGRRVRLSGFLLPIHLEDGLVTEFLLLRNHQLCCYGVPPSPNEWVDVKMTGRGVKPEMDIPLECIGTLRVGELVENGVLEGIYQLQCQSAQPSG